MGNLENGKPVEQKEDMAEKGGVYFILRSAQKNLLSCARSENNIFLLSMYEKH